MIIRSILDQDLKEISRLHKKTFSRVHFTSFFSEKLLIKYFAALCRYNNLCFAAEDSGNIIGYIIGGNNIRLALDIFVRKNFISVLLIFLFHPEFIIEKIKLLKQSHVSASKYRIFLIAVNPEVMGTGIGGKLLNHFENELKKNGIESCGLSVRNENIEAEKFYIKNGYEKEGTTYLAAYYTKKIV